MNRTAFPVIDPVATGKNIRKLRMQKGLTVRELQDYFGFDEPRAIYKWQRGDTLPSVDNLYALGRILEVPLEEILVAQTYKLHIVKTEQQTDVSCSNHFAGCPGWSGLGFGFNHLFRRFAPVSTRCRNIASILKRSVIAFKILSA